VIEQHVGAQVLRKPLALMQPAGQGGSLEACP
jgi:hypothetical protein